MEWISVDDRLPEDERPVLCWKFGWHQFTGSFYMGDFFAVAPTTSALVVENVTHWMSLPAPPEAKP